MNKKEIELTKKLIALDDRVILSGLKIYRNQSCLYETKNQYSHKTHFLNLCSFVFFQVTQGCWLKNSFEKNSNQSDQIFQKLGYQWNDDESHFQRYAEHLVKLKDSSSEDVAEEFQANLDIFKAIHNHPFSYYERTKNREGHKEYISSMTKDLNDAIEDYNQRRGKNITLLKF